MEISVNRNNIVIVVLIIVFCIGFFSVMCIVRKCKALLHIYFTRPLLIAAIPALGVMRTHNSRYGIEIVGSSPTVLVVINRLINRRMTVYSCFQFQVLICPFAWPMQIY